MCSFFVYCFHGSIMSNYPFYPFWAGRWPKDLCRVKETPRNLLSFTVNKSQKGPLTPSGSWPPAGLTSFLIFLLLHFLESALEKNGGGDCCRFSSKQFITAGLEFSHLPPFFMRNSSVFGIDFRGELRGKIHFIAFCMHNFPYWCHWELFLNTFQHWPLAISLCAVRVVIFAGSWQFGDRFTALPFILGVGVLFATRFIGVQR